MEPLRPSWFEMNRGASILSSQIEENDGKVPFDYIVTPTPEAFFPALIISNLWNKMPIMPASFREGINVIPTIYSEALSGTGQAASIPRLLIVSMESCVELDKAFEHYESQGHDVTTAALYYRENALGLKPNFFWYTIGVDVRYPWENE